MEPEENNTHSFVMLSENTKVGRYRIIRQIGAGGMGEVYLAQDAELDRQVALKFLPPHLCRDEECRRRFKREAQAAAKLDHPNIIQVFEVAEYHDRPYFAMQHVEGRSLTEFSKDKDLSIERILELAIQICEGLHAAHDKGVIHRDIKPSNILVDSHGRARIVDFGLASVVGTDQLTKTGSTLGTIGYMSPEQVQGQETDQRSDLFSFGVVLYELLAKQNPFKRDSEAATLKALSDDHPHPLARYRAGIPDGVQAIIDKALEKNVKTRYQHADGMVSDLMRVKRSMETASTGLPTLAPDKSWLSRLFWPATTVIAVAVILAIAVPWLMDRADDRPDKVMLAVLPFENLGDPDDEYFADGITEEITTNLARLSGLGVISRTSAIQYKNSDKSLKQIGKELKVDCVLEGTIRWDKSGGENRVRINPQLIRVSDDVHLWADRYDAILNDVFEVQSTIAREVSAALDITLLQSEQDALDVRPDVNPEAYEYYLRGKQFFSFSRYLQDELRTAERMHLKAIELAPGFAPAYAELATLYTELHWEGTDTTQAILDSARGLIDIALGLAPDTPEPHNALGWYYYHGLRDFDRAIEEFTTSLQMQPNNALAIASIAWVRRRQGKWEEAIRGLERAVQLAPREPWYYYELALTYLNTRQLKKAIETYDRGIDLQPNNEWAFLGKSWAVLNLTEDPAEALRVVDRGLVYTPQSPTLAYIAVYYHCIASDYEGALDLLTGPRDVYLMQYNGGIDYYSMKGWVYHLMQKPELGGPYFDSARVILEGAVVADPNVAEIQSTMGLAYAGLGQKDEAIAAARRGVELLPVSVDALDGPRRILDLARVYCSVSEFGSAIDQLDSLLSVPSWFSVTWLKIAPEFDPLRDHPRFQALLDKHERETQDYQ